MSRSVQADVQDGSGVGQGANGDRVDAGLGDGADGCEGHAPGRFQHNRAGGATVEEAAQKLKLPVVTYDALPTVTSISPTEGPTGGATKVTIKGTNFVSGATVDFGTTPATGVTVNSDTSITATAPAGTGTVDVTVTTPSGPTSATSTKDHYTYL